MSTLQATQRRLNLGGRTVCSVTPVPARLVQHQQQRRPRPAVAAAAASTSSPSSPATRAAWRCRGAGAARATTVTAAAAQAADSAATASAAEPAPSTLALHVGDTTVQLPFTAAQAAELDAALAKLLQTFVEKQEAKRPRRWEMMEVRFKGSADTGAAGLELFEVFCNPNAHASAFDAKLLVTVKAAGGVRVACEGRLSAIKADLDAFLASL